MYVIVRVNPWMLPNSLLMDTSTSVNTIANTTLQIVASFAALLSAATAQPCVFEPCWLLLELAAS